MNLIGFVTIALLGSFIFLPDYASAQSVTGNKKNQFIYLHNKRLNKKKFEDKYPNATVLTPADQMAAKRAEVLSLPKQRKFFQRAGLAKYVKKWDQLAKDQLILSLRALSLPILTKRYKKIPKPILAKAKKRLKNSDKK